MDPQLSQTYRASYSTLFVWLVPVLVVIETIKSHLFMGVPWGEFSLARNLNLILLLAFALAAFLVWGLRSILSAEGLASFTATGRMLFVPWNEIIGARRESLLFLPFYALQLAGGGNLYLPRFLSHQREFDAIVQAVTAPNHPLRRCIAEIQESAVDSSGE